MDMIDEELNRLKNRLDDLKNRILPDLQSKTEMLFARIMPMPEGSEQRLKLEEEYALLSKELRMRSDEQFKTRQSMDNLEFERRLSKR